MDRNREGSSGGGGGGGENLSSLTFKQLRARMGALRLPYRKAAEIRGKAAMMDLIRRSREPSFVPTHEREQLRQLDGREGE